MLPPLLASDTPHLTLSLMGSSVTSLSSKLTCKSFGLGRAPECPGSQPAGACTGAQVCGEPAPHWLPGRPEGEGGAAQGWEAGDNPPAVLSLLALRPQPRRGLGLARTGTEVPQPHSFWFLRSPRRAGRRSPCSQDRNT